MNCEWIQQHIHSFLDGELVARDRTVVEEHLATCADCAELLRRTEEEERGLRSALACPRAPAGFVKDVMDAIQASSSDAEPGAPKTPAPWKWRRCWTLVGAAAAAAVCIALRLLMVGQPEQSSETQAEASLSPPVAATAVATVAEVKGSASCNLPTGGAWEPLSMGDRLPAGTRLKTDAGALVELRLRDMVTSLVDQKSVLRLTEKGLFVDSGRVFSSVDPGGAGFAIETLDACATVTGTQFEVDRRADGVTRLRVVEGTVHFVNAKGSVSVGANMEASAKTDTGPGGLLHADHLPALSWASVDEDSFDFPVDLELAVREIDGNGRASPRIAAFQANLDHHETRYGALWMYCQVTDASAAVVLRRRERVSSRDHRYRVKKVAFGDLAVGSYTARFRIGHGEHAVVAEVAFSVR